MNEIVQFKTAEIAERIENTRKGIIKLYKENGYDDAVRTLEEKLSSLRNDNKIRVVVIGQYDAGKSTIISALTRRSDIKISSNIATSETRDYEWGSGVLLTDTPGLQTDNPEHDAITLDMIGKSDLLVYCITSDLFNPYTTKDFCQLAFEKGYAEKMFLIINKMSKEDGEFENLKSNYELSINKAISPHSIQELPCSFVDAQDYKSGMKEGNQELVEYSHFQDLIVQLNSFISQKGYLGKLDAPIMVLKASIDEVTEQISDNDADRAYSSVLSRLEKKIDQHRNQISIQAHNIVRRGLSKITDYGDELSRKVGVEKVRCTDNDIEELIANTCQDINEKLESLCSRGIEQLNEELDEVTSSEAFSYFFKSVEGEYTEKGHVFESKQSKINRAKVDSVRNILETISGKTISLTTKTGTTVTNTMFKVSDVTGSPLHEAVLAIGKQFGYKFKPWEAAKITKHIGNAAKMIGPLMSIVGLAMDVKETADEIERDEKIRKQQIETRQIFISIASDLETKYSEELSRMFDVYDDISNQITRDRDRVQQLVRSSSEMSERLYLYKKELIAIQGEIF